MSYRASKVNYCYLVVPSRSGAAANILAALKAAGLNLLAFSGFPVGKGKAQLDLVAARLTPIQKLAKTQGWKLSRPKKGFMIQGEDGVGAGEAPLAALAAKHINIVAADAVAAGGGRFGMLLWVKPKDYERAAKALGIGSAASRAARTAATEPAPV